MLVLPNDQMILKRIREPLSFCKMSRSTPIFRVFDMLVPYVGFVYTCSRLQIDIARIYDFRLASELRLIFLY